MIETLEQAIQRLLPKPFAHGAVLEAVHTYTDEHGNALYWRARLRMPDGAKMIRPLRLNGDRYELGEPVFGPGAKPLYGLDRVAANPGACVEFVEGENVADALVRLGVLATTSGGASSAPSADLTPVAGRICRIWPDNDPQGQRYARELAGRLAALGCTVSIVDVSDLNLGAGGDAVDWLRGHPLATKDEVAALASTPWVPKAEDDPLRPLSVAEVRRLPRPAWLVRNFLPASSLVVLFGNPGSGKSFVALDLACSIARGVPWRGLPVRRGTVVYVACEGNLGARLDAYLAHHGVTEDNMPGLWVIPHPVNLLTESGTDAVIRSIVAVTGGEPVALVVIDTLNRAMPGGNENTSEHMGAVIDAAGRLTRELGGATVAFVHHSGKDRSKGARGHSSLRGAVDAEIEFTVGEPNEPREIEVTKLKEGEDGARYGFALLKVIIGADEDGESITSCVVIEQSLSPSLFGASRSAHDKTLEMLRKLIEDEGRVPTHDPDVPPDTRVVPVVRWREVFVASGTARGTYKDEGSARVNFTKQKKKLLDGEKIGQSDEYVWIVEEGREPAA